MLKSYQTKKTREMGLRLHLFPLLILLTCSEAFPVCNPPLLLNKRHFLHQRKHFWSACHSNEFNEVRDRAKDLSRPFALQDQSFALSGRRRSVILLASTALVLKNPLSWQKHDRLQPNQSNPENEVKPITVFGCDGSSGKRVVDLVIAKGIPTRSIHHSVPREKRAFIRGIPNQDFVAEIENASSVNDTVKGSRAVICVVGIRPKARNGVIQEFDDGNDVTTFTVGYANLAKYCIENNVPRLIILSSSCFYKSSTCESLDRGEEILRKMYANAPDGLSYAIVRSGRLFDGESQGAEEIEVNQGGQKSGLISRMDVAHLLVELAVDKRNVRATLETFYSNTAQPKDLRSAIKTCEERGVNLKDCIVGRLDENNHTVVYPTGKEHFSNGNWGDLFTDLENDEETPTDILEFGSGYL